MAFSRTRTLMVFYRSLAQMVASGIPLIEALGIVATDGKSASLGATPAKLKQFLESGSTFADSLGFFSSTFPELHVSLIRAAETSGRLALGLENLADYLEEEYAVQQALLVGFSYPFLVLNIALFLLPIVFAMRCGGCYILSLARLLVLVYGSGFLVYVMLRLRQTDARFAALADRLILGIPWFGAMAQGSCLSRFIRTLQALVASGVGIVTGWKMAAQASGNAIIREKLMAASESIEQGKSLSQAFASTGLFDLQTVSLIATAEKSGSIVQALKTLVDYCQRENEVRSAIMVRLMPVIVYLLIAGLIGFAVISFYVGYFNRVFNPG